MRYAAITGWGKCVPPAVMTNDDLSTFLDTSDEWIFSRSGIRRRHYSHVTTGAMARVAAEHALAAAALEGAALDLIVLGSTTPDDIVPNTASKLKNELRADRAACFDLNAACTSFLYGLTVATDMIRAGSVRRALVVGAEKTSWLMDWSRRESAVLFGDGAGAVVLEPGPEESGLVAGRLGCVPDTRHHIFMPNWGHGFDRIAENRIHLSLQFDGREIFRHAVRSMAEACEEVLQAAGWSRHEVVLFVPHQANLRIIDALAKRLEVERDRVVVCIEEYGNTSAASIPVALCDALEAGRVTPGARLLTAAFGAGLTWGTGAIRWGDRVVPLGRSDAALPPCSQTALELMAPSIEYYLAGRRGNPTPPSE
ncbi:MAG: beta-ketoacyl-ACP synthase 3 [Deferrisomatales bacterium]